MSRSIFAPLAVKELYVVASEFKFNHKPTDHSDIKMEFALSGGTYEVEELDESIELHTLSQELDVRTHLVNSDDLENEVGEEEPEDENQEDEHMNARAVVYIKAVCRAPKGQQQVEAYMRGSCLSIAYGHARSYISNMAAMSPMGAFLIPAVDPFALLQDLEEEQEQGADS